MQFEIQRVILFGRSHICGLDHTQGILEGNVEVPHAIVGYLDEEQFVVIGRKSSNWCDALLSPHEIKSHGTRQLGYTWGGIGVICGRQDKTTCGWNQVREAKRDKFLIFGRMKVKMNVRLEYIFAR